MKYVLVALMVVMAGCNSQNKTAGDLAYDYQDLRSYEDAKNGVTCYRVVGYDGLSCIKTKASAKEQLEEQMIKEIFQPKGE